MTDAGPPSTPPDEPLGGKGRTLTLQGATCRHLRESLGLSREGLAARSSGNDALSVATIKRAEIGKPVFCSSAAALAQVLGVPLTAILPSSPFVPDIEGTRATVAVLTFRALDRTRDSTLLAQSFSESLAIRLSRSWFPVIARGSCANLQPSSMNASRVCRLGVHYWVEGAVQSNDGRQQIFVSLVDSATRQCVWAGQFERDVRQGIFAEDPIVAGIVNHLGSELLAAEGERARRLPDNRLTAWQLTLRGVWYFHRPSAASHIEARRYFARALEADQSSTLPRYLSLLTHQHDLLNQWTDSPESSRDAILDHSKQLDNYAPESAHAHVAAGYANLISGSREEAKRRLLNAIDIDFNSPAAHSLYGQVLAMESQHHQGLHELGMAYSLNPCDPGRWSVELTTALAHFVGHQYQDAIDWANKAVLSRPSLPICRAALAAILCEAGEVEQAKLVLHHGGTFTQIALKSFDAVLGCTQKDIADRFLDALRRLGLS